MRKALIYLHFAAFPLVAQMANAERRDAESIEDTRERFLRFAHEGIADVNRVSDEEVRRVLAEGIASDDRHVVDLTVLALNLLTMQRLPALRRVQAYGSPIRPIARTPGLKRFLIDHWRAHVQGRDREVADMGIPRPDWYGQWRPATFGKRGTDVELSPDVLDEFWNSTTNAPKWGVIPTVLAAHWPRDPEVLDLIWECREYLSAEVPATAASETISLLDLGEFDTPEADSFRQAHSPAEVLAPDSAL